MNSSFIFQKYNYLAEFFRFFSRGICYIFINFTQGYNMKNTWILCKFVLIFIWKLYEKCGKNNLIMYYEVFTHMSIIVYELIIHMVLIWMMYELNRDFMSWNHVKILCSSLSTLSHVFHVLFSCDILMFGMHYFHMIFISRGWPGSLKTRFIESRAIG